jgi:hypothetical protein
MDEYTPNFKIYFNKNRQWLSVYLWDVHPNTFQIWKGGRWGYFHSKWDNPKLGFFGELHFVKSRLREREDTVSHELLHALIDWMWSNGFTITRLNEEKMCEFMDELTRKFYREYRKTLNP